MKIINGILMKHSFHNTKAWLSIIRLILFNIRSILYGSARHLINQLFYAIYFAWHFEPIT